MIYWKRKNGERITIKELPTAEIIEGIKIMEAVVANGHPIALERVVNKALTRLQRQLKRRSLL